MLQVFPSPIPPAQSPSPALGALTEFPGSSFSSLFLFSPVRSSSCRLSGGEEEMLWGREGEEGV